METCFKTPVEAGLILDTWDDVSFVGNGCPGIHHN
jgi:hypothetical protein